jgi:hypothetical protein
MGGVVRDDFLIPVARQFAVFARRHLFRKAPYIISFSFQSCVHMITYERSNGLGRLMYRDLRISFTT